VKEYLGRSPWQRFLYRLYRSPLVLFVIGPAYLFIIKNRLPLDTPKTWKKEWASIMWTNVALAGVIGVAWATIGLGKLFLVQMPMLFIALCVGVWLFYIQHQFEDTYWRRHPEWDFYRAGLEGSSYYDLPKWLHWFTGNIGYHHIHHLSSKIPNYKLPQCFREIPELHHVTRLTFWSSLSCIRLKLWDEASGRLIGFRDLARMAPAPT
ncbi:MAG: fatty acid desaturase, partial [Acidobacteriota bacterium]